MLVVATKIDSMVGKKISKTTLWATFPPFPFINTTHRFLASLTSQLLHPLNQSYLHAVVNLSLKIASFLPVVSSNANVFAVTLEKSPLFLSGL